MRLVANNVTRPGTAWNSAGVIYSIREIENMSSVKKEQPDDFFDPSKLSESTLRKYQSYFKIECPPEELRERIRNHFYNEFKVDTNVVLERFLKLKRDEKQIRRSGRSRTKPVTQQ